MNFGFPFLPSMDTESVGEVFLPAHPKQLLQFGEISDVPYINGITSDEGIVAINSKYYKHIHQNTSLGVAVYPFLLNNSMAYGTKRFLTEFTRALQ